MAGRDTVAGDAGDDFLRAGDDDLAQDDGSADRLSCGESTDKVLGSRDKVNLDVSVSARRNGSFAGGRFFSFKMTK